MAANSRQTPRFPLALRVELTRGLGMTRNLSVGGVYFVTDQPQVRGDPIDFNLLLETLRAERPVRLRCSGTVLRVEPQAAGGTVGVAASIETYRIV